jgi:hypothetical protein
VAEFVSRPLAVRRADGSRIGYDYADRGRIDFRASE